MLKNKVPKVLQVLPSLVYGGVERGTVDLALFLKQQGGNPMVASAGGPLVQQLEKQGITHITLPLNTQNPLKIWKNTDTLKKLIASHNIDIVHARSRAPAWSAYFATKSCNIPFVTTFHAIYGHRNWIKRLYNSVMTKGDRIIAISDGVKKHISQTYKAKDKNIVRIYRGIDFHHFDPRAITDQQKKELLTEWQLSEEDKIILMPGRLSRIKGHINLLNALYLIKDLKWHAVFLGGFKKKSLSKYQQQIMQEVKHLGLENRITFIDTCYNMPIAYSLAHVVVVPSLIPEAFGRTIAEAGAMEKPVIASNHGGAREIITPQTGWLYAPKNPETLVDCLKEALDLPGSKLAKMGKASRKRIQENFSLRVMCQETLKVYQDIFSSMKV